MVNLPFKSYQKTLLLGTMLAGLTFLSGRNTPYPQQNVLTPTAAPNGADQTNENNPPPKPDTKKVLGEETTASAGPSGSPPTSPTPFADSGTSTNTNIDTDTETEVETESPSEENTDITPTVAASSAASSGSDSNSNSESNSNSTSNGTKTVDAPSATAAAQRVAESLKDPKMLPDLYNLFSHELTSIFDEESWQEALTAGGSEILEVGLGTILLNGDWAEQEITLKTVEGWTLKYLMVLHLENDEWKLWGTISE